MKLNAIVENNIQLNERTEEEAIKTLANSIALFSMSRSDELRNIVTHNNLPGSRAKAAKSVDEVMKLIRTQLDKQMKQQLAE